MNQNEFRVNLFPHADGTLAVHGGDIQGLVIDTDDISEFRSELQRITRRLLRTNHGLSDDQIEKSSIRLMIRSGEEGEKTEPKARVTSPQILWEDDPRIMAVA